MSKENAELAGAVQALLLHFQQFDAVSFGVLVFIPTLLSLMRSQKPALSQLDLARRSGINSSTVSRIMDGSRLPSREQVGMFCVGISEDRSQRVELLLAWLRDEASAAVVAGIDDRHYKITAVSESGACALPASLAADLELIAAECVAHDDVRAVVTNLAHALLRHRAELADAQATVVPFTELVAEPPAPKYPAGSRPYSRG